MGDRRLKEKKGERGKKKKKKNAGRVVSLFVWRVGGEIFISHHRREYAQHAAQEVRANRLS